MIRHTSAAVLALAAIAASSIGASGSAIAAPPAPTHAAVKATTAPTTHLVKVGSNPYAVAVSQSLGKAFVVNDGSVSVVSLLTHRELDEFDTGGFHGQNSVALLRNNTQGYIANNMKNTVTVFDTETHKVTKQIAVGYGAVDVDKANTPQGQRAFVLTNKPAGLDHKAANALVAIKTRTGTVVHRTALPDDSDTATTAPGGRRIWVGSQTDGTIWQVDTTTGRLVKTVEAIKSGPISSIAFTPGGRQVWVSGIGGITVLNAKTGKTVKFITAPKIFPGFSQLGTVAVSASGQYTFVANSVSRGESSTPASFAAISTKTYKVAWRVKTGSQPEAFALDRTRNVAYVPNYDDDTVTYFSVPK